MKYLLILLSLILVGSCQSNIDITTNNTPTKTSAKALPFFVGTYTSGNSEGIYKYSLSPDGKLDSIHLAAKLENPSYISFSANKKYLIACVENKIGDVNAYTITNDSLKFNNSIPSGGAYPCFVTTNEEGNVLVANYGGGNVALLNINPEGSLSALDLQHHTGKGQDKRQDKPHAHSAYFLPQSNKIVSADLGTNEMWFSKIINNKLIPDTTNLQMYPASGPRHLAIHKNGWLYVIHELNNTVSLVSKNKMGIYQLQASTSTLPDTFSAESFCADIHLSPDGKFLYASNRGHNSITLFGVSPKDGSLNYIENYSIHGDWPRNFGITPNGQFLVVANQKSNNIVSFSINKTTGQLTFIDDISAPNPVCLLFE